MMAIEEHVWIVAEIGQSHKVNCQIFRSYSKKIIQTSMMPSFTKYSIDAKNSSSDNAPKYHHSALFFTQSGIGITRSASSSSALLAEMLENKLKS